MRQFVRALFITWLLLHVTFEVGCSGPKPLATEVIGSESENFRPFPWPPPKWTTAEVLPRSLIDHGEKSMTLGMVKERLQTALDPLGYTEVGFYAVPNGFAMATKPERFDTDGKTLEPPDRYSEELLPPLHWTLSDYIDRLFYAKPGRYRIIVFVVTDHAFAASEVHIDKETADDWVRSGNIGLPPDVRLSKFTENHAVTAVIYEFLRSDNEHPIILNLNSNLTARTHLTAAKVWQGLGGSE